jgi:MerR family transcriptional regulator/heat shock protein HspR
MRQVVSLKGRGDNAAEGRFAVKVLWSDEMTKGRDQPLYMISVVARLVQCHPQTLRQYEDLGLLEPVRTPTNQRLYSDDDVERARQIRRLTRDLGVNLAGVEVVLDLLDKMESLRQELSEKWQNQVTEMEQEMKLLRAGMKETTHGSD